MLAIRPALRDYAWGSRHAIARLQGRDEPSAGPEAEAWFGAHPLAPAVVEGTDGTTLLDVIDADPLGTLGGEVVARFGPRLPFLVKLLAAEAPLSLQAHPSAAQAEAGFAAEEARGVPRDAPERNYPDPWPKPELLHALTPFAALCGFRAPADTVRLLDALAVPGLAGMRDRLHEHGEAAFASTIAWALRDGRDEASAALPELRAAAERLADRFEVDAVGDGPVGGLEAVADAVAAVRWLATVIERYPDDPGCVVALLLELVELQPGQAVHLPAGTLHAYLHGAGVEVMASSDNVLRGGLTSKHVDVDELLAVLRPCVLPPLLVDVRSEGAEQVQVTPTPTFRQSILPLTGTPVPLRGGGPQLLVVLDGDTRVRADDTEVVVPRGHGAFVAADAPPVEVSGTGRLFRTVVGDAT